jgi:hypothetical protein
MPIHPYIFMASLIKHRDKFNLSLYHFMLTGSNTNIMQSNYEEYFDNM